MMAAVEVAARRAGWERSAMLPVSVLRAQLIVQAQAEIAATTVAAGAVGRAGAGPRAVLLVNVKLAGRAREKAAENPTAALVRHARGIARRTKTVMLSSASIKTMRIHVHDSPNAQR